MSPNAQQDIDTFAFVYPTGEPSKQAIRDSALYQHLTYGENVPYLRIRFSDISSSSRGITFGSDQGCHVVLKRDEDVSRRHFCLDLNKSRQAMIYDWGSRNGTYVVYTSTDGTYESTSNGSLVDILPSITGSPSASNSAPSGNSRSKFHATRLRQYSRLGSMKNLKMSSRPCA